MKPLSIVLISIALLSAAIFSGPMLVLLILVSTLVYFALRGLYRAMDLNKDGKVNFDDLRYLLGAQEEQPETPEGRARDARSFMDRRLHDIWQTLEEDFVLLSVSIQAREKQASRGWRRMFSDKHARDVSRIVEMLARELEDPILSDRQHDFQAATRLQTQKRNQLAEIEASMSMSFGGTASASKLRTKESTEAKIRQIEARRETTVDLFAKRLESYGLKLSSEQAEVLLSRIDSSDVGQMTVVFAIIARLTAKLAAAKAGSSENLDVTRKYYGIYLGLLELQLFLQSQYIDSVNDQYLPGVDALTDEAKQLLATTKAKLKASHKDHEIGYESNIKAQEFTINVSEVYASTLRNDRAKVMEAKKLVTKQHELAENTLSTVRVSADLSSLIQQGEQMYAQVMDLQTPALVPFENLQMQREFEALTTRLRT